MGAQSRQGEEAMNTNAMNNPDHLIWSWPHRIQIVTIFGLGYYAGSVYLWWEIVPILAIPFSFWVIIDIIFKPKQR